MGLARASFTLKSRTVRRSSGKYFDELTRNERLPLRELLALQTRRSVAIASFAAAHSPFYRDLFAAHDVGPERLGSVDQWERIPVIDRATVKANAARITSSEATSRTARSAKTGGSTGEPLRTLHDNRVPNLALAWRMYRWWDVEPWDNLARVGRWGFGAVDSLKNTLSWWPSKQVYLDAMLFDERSMRSFYNRLVKTRPALIEGYVGAMLEFANFLQAGNLELPSIRAVATTAAPLTANVRARLEDVYGVQIYDEYRGSEVNWLAGECRAHNGLHIFADARVVEVVDNDGRRVPDGQLGDIVVTDLTNRVFPLIRYKVGDRGALLDQICTCGVTLPMMAPPEGRTADIIRTPSGKALNHGMMAMFAEHHDSVRLFQIHQSADYSVRIRVIKGDGSDAETHVNDAVDALRRRIDGEMPVVIEYVNALPYSGGKTKYIISDVPEG